MAIARKPSRRASLVVTKSCGIETYGNVLGITLLQEKLAHCGLETGFAEADVETARAAE